MGRENDPAVSEQIWKGCQPKGPFKKVEPRTKRGKMETVPTKTYRRSLREFQLDPDLSQAQKENWSDKRIKLHQGLQKVQSSAATQIRTQHISLNRSLFKRKVPDIEGPGCPCGWQCKDVKHVLISCPQYNTNRPALFAAAGTYDYQVMVGVNAGGDPGGGQVVSPFRGATTIFSRPRTASERSVYVGRVLGSSCDQYGPP